METPTVLNTGAAAGQDFTAGSEKCYICLSSFEEQAVGSLEECQHVFCLECILQWSQTANTCPVDRIAFAFILQRRCPGGDIQKKIKVRTQSQDAYGEDDEEEGSTAVFCERCGRRDRRHRLLVCTQCDSGYHMDCLTPSLNTWPEGDWICSECAGVGPQPTDSSVVEEEISDGELTDLLAEVDETASTSSRLRPSTVNRPSSSTARRRSQRIRIRSRTSGSHDPRPQTSWHVPKYLLRAPKPSARTEEAAAHHRSGTSSASVIKDKRKKEECSSSS